MLKCSKNFAYELNIIYTVPRFLDTLHQLLYAVFQNEMNFLSYVVVQPNVYLQIGFVQNFKIVLISHGHPFH